MATPPKTVRDAARRGLELRREFGRGGTAVGVSRARDLSHGADIPVETLRRMKAFFDRHEQNKDTPPEEGNGRIAWLLWGGDAGRRWAESQLKTEKSSCAELQPPGVSEAVGSSFKTYCKISGVNEDLGIIFGYAIVSREGGEDYYDLQHDHIPPVSMLKGAADFALSDRTGGLMHERDEDGNPVRKASIPFLFPLTQEIGASLGITVEREGLLIGYKPDDPEIIKQTKAGVYKGFSIGGQRIHDVEIDDEGDSE